MDKQGASKIVGWKSEYNTGVDRIDFEHKIFLELLNSFKKALDLGKDKEEINRIVVEIEKYAEFHFISEENLMQVFNYPDYENHKFLHLDLLEEFNSARNEQYDYEKFYEFLLNWFINHTVNEDIQIRKFVEEKEIKIDDYYNISI